MSKSLTSERPRWLATLLGIATVGLGFYLIFTILLGQVDAINAAMPRYLSRFQAMVADLTEWLGPDRAAKVRDALASIDVTKRLPGLIASTQSIIITALLIIAYIAFLFVEQGQVGAKIAAMFSDNERRKKRTNCSRRSRRASGDTSGSRQSSACLQVSHVMWSCVFSI